MAKPVPNCRRRRLRVAVVGDNPDLLELLIRQINRSRCLKGLGAYGDGEKALKEIPRIKPDVVLMDIRLPGMDGIECTRRLRALLPHLHVVMLTEHENTDLIFEAFKAGAIGYLLRDRARAHDIEKAVEEVMAGGSPMTAAVARKLVQYFQQKTDTPGIRLLTNREREVLDCLAQGWAYKEIASRLGVSINTARKHLCSIYRKLQVRSKTEAVLKYVGSRPPHPNM